MKKAGFSVLCASGIVLLSSFAMAADVKAPAAKEAPKAVAPTAGALSAATKLAETMLSKTQYDQMLAAIKQMGAGMLQGKAQQSGKKVDVPALTKKLDAKLAAKFSYAYFTKMNVDALVKVFSEDELKKVLAFYVTPEGKKWIVETPEVVKKTMMQTQSDLQTFVPKMVEELGVK